ncbi:helix-turn-helix domain-containing protein [Pseudomonas promysalinigenes]|uniref:helix-turn-helix domain-containing protein n=1 Tax=Pseudomonas promysalinigenes TaxID=485898 RepID=UPI0039170CBA
MKDFFPVQSTSVLYRIGLLMKEARLRMGLRQADLAKLAGISLRAIRHMEGGKAEGVSLRDFMLALFTVGISDRIFQSLIDDPALDLNALEANTSKRVKLPSSNAEDF